MFLLIQLFLSTALAAPAQNTNTTQTVVEIPPVHHDIVNNQDGKPQNIAIQIPSSLETQNRDAKKCFFNGKWYPGGSVIRSGRSWDWCFGSYCDVDGTVKHWDDYNCGGAQTAAQQQYSLVKPQQSPVTPSPYVDPPTTTMIDYFGKFGCWYRGRFYWSGTDVENFRLGFRCFGKYCDWDGKLQSWSDDCRYAIPPATTPIPDYSFLLIQLFLSTALAAPAQYSNITQTVVKVPPINQDIKPQDTAAKNPRNQDIQNRDAKKCFFNGKWYPGGSEIRSGRSWDWCFGSYCDVDGTVKHWDDYNCGGAQNAAFQQPGIVKPQQPVTPSPYSDPPTTLADYLFGSLGCWYSGRFYWSGTDVENFRRGLRCFGKYCDWDGKLQSWSDDCRYAIPPALTPMPDYT